MMREIIHEPLAASRRVRFLRVQAENEEGEPENGGGWVVVRDGIESVEYGWQGERVLRLTPQHAIRLATELLVAAEQAEGL